MSCTKHFLNFHWEHHTWSPRVTFAESMATKETNMWGRPVYGQSVRCQKEEVCTECGKVRRDVSCLCDTEHGEHCAILQNWIDESHHTPL